MTDRIDPKAIADELRARVERGTYSGGGYKYVEVGPEDAILAADAIEALVKERDDLAAVIENLRGVARGYIDQPGYGDYYIGMESAGEGVLALLDEAPTDALREHDAALIESLADDRGVDASEDHDDEWWVGYRQAQREIVHWLTERARQVREGEA